MCYYKNKSHTAQNDIRDTEMEISKIKRILNSEMVEKSEWTIETIVVARKAIITGLVMAVLFVYSGVTPMLSYTSLIFHETGSNLSPNMSAIVIGAIQLIGTCVGTYLVERVGRKVSAIRNPKSNIYIEHLHYSFANADVIGGFLLWHGN